MEIRREAVGVAKILCASVNIVRQITEREGRRVCLEENLPGLIVSSSIFPISKRDGKGLVLWACEENMASFFFFFFKLEVVILIN